MGNRTKLVAMGLLVAGGLCLNVGTDWMANADAQPPSGGGPGAGGPSPPGTGAPDTSRGAGGADGGFGRTGGGITAGGPLVRQWEYKFETSPTSSEEFRKLATKLGDEGWDFAGQVSFTRFSDVVFKRPKPSGASGGFNPFTNLSGAGFGMAGGGNFDELFEAALKRRDRNGDGKLNKEEASAIGALADNFDQADKNKDGFIGLDEYKAFVQPRVLGGGPGASGSDRLPNTPRDAPGPGRLPMELKLYQLKNADATSMVRILTDLFSNRPELRVIPDRRTNTVIVHGSAADIDIITALISRLDSAEDVSGGKAPPKK